jgi:hypothetical protein
MSFSLLSMYGSLLLIQLAYFKKTFYLVLVYMLTVSRNMFLTVRYLPKSSLSTI